MKKSVILSAFLLASLGTKAQNYDFKEVINLDHQTVIAQGNTGTCWSFATTSFLESEITRITGKKIDLSEIYQARTTYPLKAENYIMRQGKANFSEGALAHDVMKSAIKYGLVPNKYYTGLTNNQKTHNHAEMVAVLDAMLKTYLQSENRITSQWKKAINSILDIYLGEIPEEFEFEEKEFTPLSFMEMVKIKPENYVTLTSFIHEPLYKPFILNVPDNFSNGSMYNVTLEELMNTADFALENGFTIAYDADVSEKYFTKEGIAFVPENEDDIEKGKQEIVIEKTITPELRQEEFESLATTDDHLMHIVGKVKDVKNNEYYIVKNSWGEKAGKNGYFYVSKAYFKLKTIAIMVHKESITKEIRKKLNL